MLLPLITLKAVKPFILPWLVPTLPATGPLGPFILTLATLL